jgi:hypothetical protein
MTALVLRWSEAPRVQLRWVGADGKTEFQQAESGAAIAAVVGPPGAVASVGPGFKLVGNEIRYDISSLTGV